MIRTYEDSDGETWYYLADVASALGYKSTQALAYHVRDAVQRLPWSERTRPGLRPLIIDGATYDALMAKVGKLGRQPVPKPRAMAKLPATGLQGFSEDRGLSTKAETLAALDSLGLLDEYGQPQARFIARGWFTTDGDKWTMTEVGRIGCRKAPFI